MSTNTAYMFASPPPRSNHAKWTALSLNTNENFRSRQQLWRGGGEGTWCAALRERRREGNREGGMEGERKGGREGGRRGRKEGRREEEEERDGQMEGRGGEGGVVIERERERSRACMCVCVCE